MKHIVIGTLAHVDAGKTTLSESMLFTSGSIRQMGRVDHKDAFLDYNAQERNRGITIFSKQAVLTWKDVKMTFMDTPGHVDFSTEMERVLQVLDYAVVVISALDGVQTHTKTIWKLLKHYQIPTFLFINKMDIAHHTKEELLVDMQTNLDERCIDFCDTSAGFYENVSLCDDALLEVYMEEGSLSKEVLAHHVRNRHVFPCFFGSALKMKGIETLLDGLTMYTETKQYPEEFGARIYKITRDEQGNRLTHMKIIGGSLKAKTKVNEHEKVDQIRQYSGLKYQVVQEVKAGEICAVKGMQYINAGTGLGIGAAQIQPVLSSYMNYRMVLPADCDAFAMMKQLTQLMDEDPQLHIRYIEATQEIRLQVMGEIQIEILTNVIKERFGIEVSFDQGSVNFKETIVSAIEGVGHFEPLRHYAEVHVLLEPLASGSGIQYASTCKEDVLNRRWQRLILAHMQEKEHLGVLTGSPITDMKITLLSGKAHLKHTEGGDFRQATYRAIRHGLKRAQSKLLEPYYEFTMHIPSAYVSKAIYDIEQMHGHFMVDEADADYTILHGDAPVRFMQNYQRSLRSYTKGQGELICSLKGYAPCIDEEALIQQSAYDSESDIENPCGSIFCAHGAGFYVPWEEVASHMHLDYVWVDPATIEETTTPASSAMRKYHVADEELARVVSRIHGVKREQRINKVKKTEPKVIVDVVEKRPECVLVDGYNMIFSWPSLKELALENMDAAKSRFIDMMGNYQGYRNCTLILVFDAYKVKNQAGTIQQHGNIYVVYTKTSQTADSYIEMATHRMAKDYHVVVATSDFAEQMIVMGAGAQRKSAREFADEVAYLHKTKMQEYERTQPKHRNHALEDIRKLNEE